MLDPGQILAGAATVGAAVAGARWVGKGLFTRPEPPQPSGLELRLMQWPDRVAPAAKLDGSTLTSVRGTEWGVDATVRLRPGQTIEDVNPRLSQLASALDVNRRAVRVEETGTGSARDVLLRVLERDPHADPIPWPGPSLASIAKPVTLGLYETGDPVRVKLLRRHTMLTGMTGSGKSVLESLLIGELAGCPDAQPWGIDLKEGIALTPWKPALGRLATNEAEAITVLEEAVDLIHARGKILASRGLEEWVPTSEHPQISVVVDEQSMGAASKRFIELEDEIALLGRALAVTLTVCQQRATQDSIGSKKLRAQISNNICLRVRSANETDMALGDGAADDGFAPTRLVLNGKFLVSAPDQGLIRPTPARAFLVERAQIAEVVQRFAASSRPGR